MIPLSTAVSGKLTWSRIPQSRDYELKFNGEVVGRLVRPSIWSSKFSAETRSGKWILRHSGFCRTGAEIVDSASEQQMAAFKSVWGGRGTLTFADGQMFRLECKGWWRPVWSVLEQNGQTVLRIHAREKTVEMTGRAALSDDRLALLTLFAWYRLLQAEEEAAAAASVAVMTAS